MYVEINLSVVPPATALLEPDDFTSFKVVVLEVHDALVPVDELEQLAGDRSDDPQWRQGLDKMLEYARAHGWLDNNSVRAHVEWPS